MPWHAISWGAEGIISTWTVFGRLPVVVLLAIVCWGGIRRGWAWRSGILATAALVAGALSLRVPLPHSPGVFHYFIGGQSFPGATSEWLRFAPSVGVEVTLSRRHVIGADYLFAEEGAAAGAHYRLVLGE